MLSRFRSNVTYANVVATLALFLALGGISYAAATLAKNSVGSKQLKDDAVTSDKIKDGALEQSDFAQGVISAGAKGEKGDKGDQGEQGVQGVQGAKGTDADVGLIDPSNELSGGATVQMTIDGYLQGPFKAYEIKCTTPTSCTVGIAGPQTSSMTYDTWFQAGTTQSFSLTEYDSAGTPTRRYHVTNGHPTAMHIENGRFEMTITASNVQRVAT